MKGGTQLAYFAQTLLVYIVVIASIVNLSIRDRQDPLWISLIAGSTGYLLPQPRYKAKQVKYPAGGSSPNTP